MTKGNDFTWKGYPASIVTDPSNHLSKLNPLILRTTSSDPLRLVETSRLPTELPHIWYQNCRHFIVAASIEGLIKMAKSPDVRG